MDVVQTQIKQISTFFKCQFIFHLNLSYKYCFMKAYLSQPINKITRKIFIKKKRALEAQKVCISWAKEESENVTEED